MPFTESLKVAVRKKAHLRCCICRTAGVEIHHIIPQEEAGPDTEENAAPLCPSCHELYGANATKRKFIREARDFWYDFCASQQTNSGLTLDELSSTLQSVATKHDIAELKSHIANLLSAISKSDSSTSSTDFRPVPLEQFIGSLYENNFEDERCHFDLLFDSRAWYEQGDDTYDLLDKRALFLKLYGEETAKRICLIACKEVNFNPDGFTEDELIQVLHHAHTLVIFIFLHEKYQGKGKGIQCSLGTDGEFHWRLAPKHQKSQRKTKPSGGARPKVTGRSSL